MSISNVISKYCSDAGIDIICTGGGFDFPYFSLADNGPNFTVLGLGDDVAPEDLQSPAQVNFCMNMDWMEFDEYAFGTAKEALDALSNRDFRLAVKFLKVASISEVHPELDELVVLPYICKVPEASDLSVSPLEICKFVLEKYGAKKLP